MSDLRLQRRIKATRFIICYEALYAGVGWATVLALSVADLPAVPTIVSVLFYKVNSSRRFF